MNLMLVSKAARLLLAVSVSVWMAGGCLFGCEVMAAPVSHDANEANESSAAVSGDSCNKARKHDCCTRPMAQKTKPQEPKAHKQPKAPQQIARRQNAPADTSALTGLPHGMKDCPLMTNGTAVTAKSSGGQVPDPNRTSIAVLPAINNLSEQTHVALGRSYLPNRGPTHLRCCVFLI